MSGPASPLPLAGAADPLAALRDWQAPQAVSWWPPAPGWWLLLALLLALLGAALWWWSRRWQRRALLRAALAQLARLGDGDATGADPRVFGAGLSRLLRRLALARYPRERVAGLSGAAWLAFLEETGPRPLPRPGAELLLTAPFRPALPPPTAAEREAVLRWAAAWIRAQGRVRP